MVEIPAPSRPGTAPSAPAALPPETLAAISRLKIWEKLKRGELHAITKENVRELFKVLDTEERGELTKEDLFLLGQVPGVVLTGTQLAALAEDCDKDNSDKITVEELYKGLTQGELAFTMVKNSLGKSAKAIDEKALELTKVVDYLGEEYETSSALWSLPQTVLLFALFMLLMSQHLDLSTASTMQTALINEIQAEGPLPLASVHDVPTLWMWLNSSYITLHFKNDLITFPYPGRVASYNQILGGIELVKTQVRAPAVCEQSEVLGRAYDSAQGGRCYRSGNTEQASRFLLYHNTADYILQQIQNLTAERWVDQNTSELDSHALYYNAHLQAFTDCHINFNFLANGFVKITIEMETFLADPYFSKLVVIADVLFASILLKMLYQETKELVPAARSGIDGLVNYMEFWNAIDWVSIVLGAVVMAYWGTVCVTVSSELQDIITQLPTKILDAKIFAKGAFLSPDELAAIDGGRGRIEATIGKLHAVSLGVAMNHETLRTMTFWYAFVLMMKFFKAFQANPRLDIVIRTLTKSAVEIIHFLIVFSVIFLCFSSAGYVRFGQAVKGFNNQYAAMFECWRMLMGDFGADLDAMLVVDYYHTHIWIICFQFMVLLILLNMLLAIIMDTYMAAKQEKGDPAEQLTLWMQIRLACFTVRETRGHLPLYTLLLQLQDEDYPVHPQPTVTTKSLRRAFEKMSKHQADYIMKRTVEWLRIQETELDLTFSDAIRILGLLKVSMLRNVEDTQQILEMMKVSQRSALEARMDAILNDEDPLGLPQGGSQLGGMGVSGSLATTAPGAFVAARGNSKQRADGGARAPSTGGFGTAGANFAAAAAGGGIGPSTKEMEEVKALLQAGFQSMRAEQQQMAESVHKQLAEQREYIEKRDAWLEQRIHALERRCEKVERGNDKVLTCLQGVDFEEIMRLPSKLDFILARRGPQGESPSQKALPSPKATLQLADAEEHRLATVPGPRPKAQAAPAAAAAPSSADSVAASRRLEERLDAVAEQVQQLLAHAEEATEARKMLWKIDLGIRQLRQAAPPQPQASTPARATPARASPAGAGRGGPRAAPPVPDGFAEARAVAAGPGRGGAPVRGAAAAATAAAEEPLLMDSRPSDASRSWQRMSRGSSSLSLAGGAGGAEGGGGPPPPQRVTTPPDYGAKIRPSDIAPPFD